MNLAAALTRKIVYVDTGEKPKFVRHEIRTGRRHNGTPSGMPIKYVNEAAISYLLSQFSVKPMTWHEVAAWACEQSGVHITTESVRTRVKNIGLGRAKTGSELNAMVAQHYIVCKLHGIDRPWREISRLLEERGIQKERHRLNHEVLDWMRRHLAKVSR